MAALIKRRCLEGVVRGREQEVVLDVLNVFSARYSDIDYYYPSRLPGEPTAGVDDIHTHPLQPRAARVSLRLGF